MKKLICVMLTVLMIASLFAGCGKTADDGVYKIAIVQQLDHASLNEIRAAIEAELGGPISFRRCALSEEQMLRIREKINAMIEQALSR